MNNSMSLIKICLVILLCYDIAGGDYITLCVHQTVDLHASSGYLLAVTYSLISWLCIAICFVVTHPDNTPLEKVCERMFVLCNKQQVE